MQNVSLALREVFRAIPVRHGRHYNKTILDSRLRYFGVSLSTTVFDFHFSRFSRFPLFTFHSRIRGLPHSDTLECRRAQRFLIFTFLAFLAFHFSLPHSRASSLRYFGVSLSTTVFDFHFSRFSLPHSRDPQAGHTPAFAGPASGAHSRIRGLPPLRWSSVNLNTSVINPNPFYPQKNKMATFKNFNNQVSIYGKIVNRNSEEKFK